MPERRVKEFNQAFFETIDSEAKAYFLGFIMADGCVMDNLNRLALQIHKKDRHILDSFHKHLESKHKVGVNGDRVTSYHHSSKIVADLIRLGCVPRKSLILEFPDDELVPSHLKHHFIRGYFDGDGSVNIKNKNQKRHQLRVSFMGTENFMLSIQERLHVNTKLRRCGNNKIQSTFEVNGNKKVKAIHDYLYMDASIFLTRKKEIFDSIL